MLAGIVNYNFNNWQNKKNIDMPKNSINFGKGSSARDFSRKISAELKFAPDLPKTTEDLLIRIKRFLDTEARRQEKTKKPQVEVPKNIAKKRTINEATNQRIKTIWYNYRKNTDEHQTKRFKEILDLVEANLEKGNKAPLEFMFEHTKTVPSINRFNFNAVMGRLKILKRFGTEEHLEELNKYFRYIPDENSNKTKNKNWFLYTIDIDKIKIFSQKLGYEKIIKNETDIENAANNAVKAIKDRTSQK